MLTLQLRYLRYAIVGVVLTVLTALIMPVLLGMSPFLDLSVPHRMMAAFAIATVFVIVVDVRDASMAPTPRRGIDDFVGANHRSNALVGDDRLDLQTASCW